MLGETRVKMGLAVLLLSSATLPFVAADFDPSNPPEVPGAPSGNETLPPIPELPDLLGSAGEAGEDAVEQLPDGGDPELPEEAEDAVEDVEEAAPGEDDVQSEYDEAHALVLTAVVVLGELFGPILDLLPADPIGFLTDNVVRPVQELPNQVTATGEARDEDDSRPAAGATALLRPDLSPQAMVLVGATAAAATVAIIWLAGSSGSLGAGASTANGLSKDLRRLLPLASPLFTRFEKETVLGHPKREALYALILQDPGVSLQALCEATNLSRTAVTHHLRLMELQHIIVSKRVGRSRHYYENGGRFGREQKDAYAVLQNERSRQVAEFVRSHPGTIQKELCDGLGIQASIAHWHVRRLREAGLVEEVRAGRTVRYLPGVSLAQVQMPGVTRSVAPPLMASPTALPAVPAPMPAPAPMASAAFPA